MTEEFGIRSFDLFGGLFLNPPDHAKMKNESAMGVENFTNLLGRMSGFSLGYTADYGSVVPQKSLL